MKKLRQNQQIERDQHTSAGFTLLELLIVIAVFSVISTIMVSILFVGLRGAHKSDLLNVIRQNGQTAMTQMVRNIRFAKSIDDPITGNATTCVNPLGPTPMPFIVVRSLTDNLETTYSCTGTSISSNSADLINTQAFSVTPGSCSFTCLQPTAKDPPTITIHFILTTNAANNLVEANSSVPFESSVTMRNANQGL